MKKELEPDHDHDDHDPVSDGGAGAIVPAPAGGALANLTGLAKVLNAVDTAGITGRSGMPMLLFKAREANGTWMHGQKKTVPEADSRWAVNPGTFQRGYICWGEGNKKIGERMLPVSLPMPNLAELPDLGSEWQEQWAVNMKCLNGADAGTEVVFKMSTVGGNQAIVGMLDAVRDRLNSGQHEGKVSPIVTLGKDSYPHSQYGKTWYPVLTIIDWMPLSGPAPAPAPTPAPTSSPSSAAEQPRRRRVA